MDVEANLKAIRRCEFGRELPGKVSCVGRVVNGEGGRSRPLPDSWPAYFPLSEKEVSCVCGLRWPSLFPSATALSLSFQMMSPRVMSDS
jgi:hypothetical protein